DPDLRSYQPVASLSGRIVGAHQDVLTWVTQSWTTGFKKIHPNVEFSLRVENTRTAMAGLEPGAAQFVTAGRGLQDPDRDAFRQRQGVDYDPLRIGVAGGTYRTPGQEDTVVFFVNEHNPLEKISLAQLDAMYSTTRNRGYKEDLK